MDIKRQYIEIEWLSDYIDNRLSIEEKSAFEKMLEEDGNLRVSLSLLQATKTLLRQSPRRRAPHNFFLTKQSASNIRKQAVTFPILRFSSALTGALSILIFAISFFVNGQVVSPNTMLAAAPMAEKSGPNEQPMIITWGSPGYGMGGGGGGGAADLSYEKGVGGGAPETMSAENLPVPPEAPQPDTSAEKSSPTPTPEEFAMAAPEAPPVPAPVPTQQSDLFQPTVSAPDSQRSVQPPATTDSVQLPAITGSGPILGINPSPMNPVQTSQETGGIPSNATSNNYLLIAGSSFLLIGIATGLAAFFISKRKY